MQNQNYKTVLSPGEDSLVIEKSKFIGYIQPVETVEAAEAFVSSIRKKHYDATHNVPVYVIGSQFEVQKYSDDGEPSGTAGLPVLEMLKKEKITNVAIVMTRYFGGIKLGTGGLVRAYTQTAKCALRAGEIIERRLMLRRLITLDYPLHGKVLNDLMSMPEVIIGETHFTECVTISLYFPEALQHQLEGALINATSGGVIFSEQETFFITVKDGQVLSLE